MIHYQNFILDNGLQVYVHEDHSTPMAAVNILYNVGSRDEDENRTGFAHLFEHLMFGGSKHIPSYDEPLQLVGGENNAFTSPDITNYYITLPAANIETAFWLESDRMLSLSFDPKVLEIQQKVVIEEFKQRYYNQPYGDVWLKLRPLAYQVHPYRWATIGKDISHIEQATLQDVQDFFYKYYLPNNAILVVAGDITLEQVKQLCKKWFKPIPAGKSYVRELPKEPLQTAERKLKVEASVPLNAIYKAFHIAGKTDVSAYFNADLLSDILGRGKSSRLYDNLVKEQKLFSNISAYTLNSIDPGLMVIQGQINGGISLEKADAAIQEIIEEIVADGIPEAEVTKVKNQAESSLIYSEVELLNRAMNLAFYANMGDVEEVNRETERIEAITPATLHQMAIETLKPENTSTLHYIATQ
ncbi:pitrilysin family protein [Cytophagaceae bacterium YF14B1]|uniref:Pitrilysin family protein n=1 Tax=Xanthocytophaga flava TaxID=3048013 RepID=A0AAE3QQ46_9BACT|nr:pitrilysin family protein [Xanthocytophaga flavus]MDJ1481165.1 pitrilysin family protein [Xanthocytophaga flavus]